MKRDQQPNRRVEVVGLMVGLVFILGVASFSFWEPWKRDLGALATWVALKLLLIVALIGLVVAVREIIMVLRARRKMRAPQQRKDA